MPHSAEPDGSERPCGYAGHVGLLEHFETRLDRLVNGAFARAFRAEVQPVEIAAALIREMDDRAAVLDRDRTVVPNQFSVELSPHDHDRLAGFAQTIADELTSVVRMHAGQRDYVLPGTVTITLHRDEALDTGIFRVVSDAVVTEPAPAAHPEHATPRPATLTRPDGTVITLTDEQMGGSLVLGRGSDVDIILDDASVSRRHAKLDFAPAPTITDLGSTNGTFVDGVRIDSSRVVDGSRITLGTLTLVVRL